MTGTTVQSVRNTVQSHIRGYGSQAEPALRALDERDYTIADNLLSAATSRGLSADQARTIITGAGLSFRPAPVAASNGSSNGSVESRLAALEQALQDAKRRFGF
jgi:hypothetical protein